MAPTRECWPALVKFSKFVGSLNLYDKICNPEDSCPDNLDRFFNKKKTYFPISSMKTQIFEILLKSKFFKFSSIKTSDFESFVLK